MQSHFWTRRSVLVSLAAPAVVRRLSGQAQTTVALQPFAQHVRRLEDALAYLGQPIPAGVHDRINAAIGGANEEQAVAAVQKLLDPLVIAIVNINGESRVKVTQGDAKPELVEGGTRLFLVKVENQAPVRNRLVVESPNSGPASLRSRGEAEPKLELTPKMAAERWADFSIYLQSPMAQRLSGLGIEYVILQVYSRDRGQRSAQLAFNVGQGTQDIGFRNDILVVFDSKPARSVLLHVTDEKGGHLSLRLSFAIASSVFIPFHPSGSRPISRSSRRSTAWRESASACPRDPTPSSTRAGRSISPSLRNSQSRQRDPMKCRSS